MALARLYRKHDPASQTRYQDLKQLARSQHRILAGTPGTLKQRTQSGNRYWVREYIRADRKKTDEYIGPESSTNKTTIESLTAEIELAKALAGGSASLRLFGYQRIDRKPAAVLEVFFNRGLIHGGLTLVGSHAYGVLLNDVGIVAPGYKTQDIDIARAGTLAVDLLVPGRNVGDVVPVKELGAYAQAIPLLDFLTKDPIDSVVLSPNQVIPVKIPSPEHFVLHKLYSSQSRRGDRDKIGKDLAQAAIIAAAVEDETPGRIKDTFRTMPTAGKSRVKRGALAAAKILEPHHPEAAAALLKIAKG